MSHFPTDSTYDDKPVCPGCGYEWDTDDPSFYDENGFEETCPDCDLKLFIQPSCSWSYSIEHPNQCEVRRHHVPWINEEYNKHECLDCHTPLTCDCTLHDKCTHNLKTLEEVTE